MVYIEDFKEGDNIMGHYLCRQKQLLKSKTGKNYLSVLLADKTGQIDGKAWDLNNNIQNFDEGDFIKIEASVQLYQSELQLRITRVRRSEPGEYTAADYIRTTDKDVNALFAQLTGYIKTISNAYVKKLLDNIFSRADVAADFKSSSAAKILHHAYIGGLIEHTLSVVQICDFVSGLYKHANRDVIVACAMLHDIGKIRELSPFPENDYTDEGQLIGHLIIGYELISDEAKKIDGFPDNLLLMIKHCILAHHGEYEYGSPKIPQIIEAYILYFCDNMDAKIKAFEEALTSDKTKSSWLGYNKMLGRNIRKSDNLYN